MSVIDKSLSLETLYHLFEQYLSELESFNHALPGEGTYRERFCSLLHAPNTRWYYLFSFDGDLVGFVIVRNGIVSHPGSDCYISDAYVLPDYRFEGLLHDWFNRFIEENLPQFVTMHIVLNNAHAIGVWHHLFLEQGYDTVSLRHLDVDETSLLLSYGWKRL